MDTDSLVKELQQAVEARDAFIAIAAHELRNPMTPILAQVERLLAAARRPDSSCPPPICAGLEFLERAIHEYMKRATTLLDVSRIAAGKLRVQPRTVDLSDAVRKAAQTHALFAERSGCRLDLRIQEGVVGICDPLALEQVVDNLVSNAIKYGAEAPIDLSLTADGGTARIVVRDRGIGISAENQARIFGRFEQAVTGFQQGGFGIGLWIVHQLLTAMGGDIAVASEPGQGSTFTVALPLTPPDLDRKPDD